MPRAMSGSRLKEKIAGDLAVKGDEELKQAFPHPIRGAGADIKPSSILSFRREKMVSDATDGDDTSLSVRMVPRDEVV